MIPFLPIFVLGGSFFWAKAKKAKPKAAEKHRVVETGPITNVPKMGESELSFPLHMGEAVAIVADETPSVTWKVTRKGMSVKMDRKTRPQSRLTNAIIFTFRSQEKGVTVATFEKLGRKGEVIEVRRLKIVVE